MASMTRAYIRDKRSIIGAYKNDNVTDPDSVYARKHELLDVLKVFKWISKIGFFINAPLLVIFILLTSISPFFFFMAFFMAPFVIGAVFMHRYCKKKEALINSATEEYCNQLGIEAV